MATFLLERVVPAISGASWTTNTMIAGVILGLLAGYTAIHFSVWRFSPNLNRWLGSMHPQTFWDHLANFQGTLFLQVLLQSAQY